MTEQLVRIYVRRAESERASRQFPDFRDGSRCGLRFQYAALDERWRMWAIDLDGTTIAGPRTLVPGVDLFEGWRHDPRIPTGQLFVYSPSREPPDAETIDVSAVLYYRRSTE